MQNARTRAVRESTRSATERSIRDRINYEVQLGERRRNRDRVERSIPETVPEMEDGGDAPYTSFTGSPRTPWGSPGATDAEVNDMEASVASLVFESAAESVVPDRTNLTNWVD